LRAALLENVIPPEERFLLINLYFAVGCPKLYMLSSLKLSQAKLNMQRREMHGFGHFATFSPLAFVKVA
jgi:hypothetical protein